ncbi:MAG: Zn-ribbon domain-containing OB-fold protein [Halobacteria archaeon]|nr:Zn-ribbon domain-containing OB-fold protein [Halobacteria archaeon]
MTVPRFWRKIDQRYRTIGSECKNCGTAYFPPRQLCPECRREGEIVEKRFSGEGEVVSYTTVHDGGEGYQETEPYTLAIVELEEGGRLTTQIAENHEVEIGTKVEPCFRKVGEDGEAGMIHYGTKFKPVK